MKSAARTTVIALVAFICVIAWFVAALGIAGAWLDCIPNDPEYGCLNPTAAWELTIGLVATVALLTVAMWIGARRIMSRRR